MAINFYPNREQLSREIEQSVATNSVEVLLGFCRCCIYNIFEKSTIVTECLKCGVQLGIVKIANKGKNSSVSDFEFLGVC